MGEAGFDQEKGALAQSSRWLIFSLPERKAAVPLPYMVKILERAEIFPMPLAGREFKGVIYYNDMAVPVLNWEFLTGREVAGTHLLILEQGNDLLGMEIGELAKVERHSSRAGAEGFWSELAAEEGLWALNVDKVFQALRKGVGKAGVGR